MEQLTTVEPIQITKLFEFHHIDANAKNCTVQIQFRTNINVSFPFLLSYDCLMASKESGIIIAASILVVMYALIVFDVFGRTFATLLASTVAIAVLTFRHNGPTMEHIMESIDGETLLLIFCMMILVAIMVETGIFDYCALLAYKVRKTSKTSKT